MTDSKTPRTDFAHVRLVQEPIAGLTRCACVFERKTDFSPPVLIEPCAYHAKMGTDLAEAQRRLADAQTRWRPCATKPPRDPEEGWAATLLLFFGGDGDGTFNLGYYHPEDGGWMVHDGGGFYELAVPEPTHWMPLPEAPK